MTDFLFFCSALRKIIVTQSRIIIVVFDRCWSPLRPTAVCVLQVDKLLVIRADYLFYGEKEEKNVKVINLRSTAVGLINIFCCFSLGAGGSGFSLVLHRRPDHN